MDGRNTSLKQFVVLAQTAQGKACEALVKQVLDHSTIFVFGELLDCPNIQSMASASPEGKQLVDLLNIFAYGTYSDYTARQDLPELSAAQCRKLKLLTIVSIATKKKLIKFSDLHATLDVASPRDLEDLIIEGIYQNLIVGKMDQENQCLVVESCACRDCHDQDIDFIISTLEKWQSSAQNMYGALGGTVQFLHESYDRNEEARKEVEALVQTAREKLKENPAEGERGSRAGRSANP